MGPESTNIEERLKSFCIQLQMESSILDKIVYKGKNQHRRCLYFQHLLKVRRDVRLLLSASLEEILKSLFLVINGKKPQRKVHLLESLKKRKCTSESYNYQERLLGVSRLLSQMVEPIVKAAIETSSLLARSFFMGFSLTILALLARLRVLVQQILLDVVSVYNMVSSVSQKKQSIKLNSEGIEVFREYYPSNEDIITLECVWETDKFVLLEKANKNSTNNPDEHIGVGKEIPPHSVNINYQTIEAFLGVAELGCQEIDADCFRKDLTGSADTKRRKTDVSDNQPIRMDNNTDSSYSLNDLPGPSDTKRLTTDVSDDLPIKINDPTEDGGDGDDKSREKSPDPNISEEGGLIVSTSPLPTLKSQKNLQTEPKNKVAFVSVGKSTSQVNKNELPEKAITSDWLAQTTNDKEDPIFSLLSGGNMKDNSLF